MQVQEYMAPGEVMGAAPHSYHFNVLPRAARQCQEQRAASLGPRVGVEDVCWFHQWPFPMPPGTPPLSSSTGMLTY